MTVVSATMDTSDNRDSVVRFAIAVQNADRQALPTAVAPDRLDDTWRQPDLWTAFRPNGSPRARDNSG